MGKINVVLFQSRMIFLSTVPGPLLSIEYKRIICQPPAHSSTLKKIQKNHEINLEIKVDHPVPFCCGVQTVPEMLPATGGDDNLQHNLPSLCSAGWYRPHCLHPFVLQVCIDLTVTSLLFCRLVQTSPKQTRLSELVSQKPLPVLILRSNSGEEE